MKTRQELKQQEQYETRKRILNRLYYKLNNEEDESERMAVKFAIKKLEKEYRSII